MIQVNYNIEERGWKENFPHFKKYIGKSVNETLKQMDKKIDEDVVVSIFLTSNQKIKKLNHQYRNENKPTNVLSFPMQSYSDGIYQLGDIVLSNQALLKESIEQKITKYDYLCKMTIHGMLHLLGYDHNTEKQFKQMNKFENIIFDNIKDLSWSQNY